MEDWILFKANSRRGGLDIFKGNSMMRGLDIVQRKKYVVRIGYCSKEIV